MPKKLIDRRDFLKLTGASALAASGLTLHQLPAQRAAAPNAPNIVVIVMDSWSARHIGQFGYGRDTMPNLDRFLEHAIVYHNHYTVAPFTTPATATMLTGMFPWNHRATKAHVSLSRQYTDHNIFRLLDNRHRLGYTHNPLANILLRQIRKDMEAFVPEEALYLQGAENRKISPNDPDALGSALRALDSHDEKFYPLLSFPWFHKWMKNRDERMETEYEQQFPRGLPGSVDYLNGYFLLEDAMDWTAAQLSQLSEPYFSYLHFFPPHDPYHTRIEFVDRFKDDGYQLVPKPPNLASRNYPTEEVDTMRRWYDEFILYVDAELARLYDLFDQNKLFDNTWVILTADHGELFERNEYGHTVPLLYEDLLRIPLIIIPPGGTSPRQDIYGRTSNLDLAPTILQLAGVTQPDWMEGKVLPPFDNTVGDPNRQLFSIYSGKNLPYLPTEIYGAVILRDQYKLLQIKGYTEPNGGIIHELYDLDNDPEETNNLIDQLPELAADMRATLDQAIEEADRPYHP